MRRQSNYISDIDWLTVLIFSLLVIFGWINIYASVYSQETVESIYNFSLNSGKQLVWIGFSAVLILVILTIDFRFYESFAYGIYGFILFLLILLFTPLGKEVSGARSWMDLGIFQLQPSEFAKFATGLALAKYMSRPQVGFKRFQYILIMFGIILLPMALIALQPDMGTVLIFGGFILVLFREGLSPVPIILGLGFTVVFILTMFLPINYYILGIVVLGIIAFSLGKRTFKRAGIIAGLVILVAAEIFSVDHVLNEVLKPHQRNRILVLVNPDSDPAGAGYNVMQSKIAIGSGGFTGKGFLNGTQTKFKFVPEQSTDFIFCTVGEEYGFLGSIFLIGLFMALILRILYLAERQKSKFARIYGYSVAGILFMHFAINIGMTIGLFPIIGIPLPLISYGGSALFGFTILIFIFLKLDAHRSQILVRT